MKMIKLGLDSAPVSQKKHGLRNALIVIAAGVIVFGAIQYMMVRRPSERRGFHTGDCYSYSGPERIWPRSYTVYRDLVQSLLAKDPYAPNALSRDGIYVAPGYEVLVYETDWDLVYTRVRITKAPSHKPWYGEYPVGEMIYTVPLAAFGWKPCEGSAR